MGITSIPQSKPCLLLIFEIFEVEGVADSTSKITNAHVSTIKTINLTREYIVVEDELAYATTATNKLGHIECHLKKQND